MHPQYVERLRNWLLKESNNKTIIIVTHNSHLINTSTAENAFVFFHNSLSPENSCYSFMSTAEINRQIIDTDELKKIIFASKVLFVEGKTEKILLEGICNWYMILCDEASDIHSIVNKHVVILGGKENTGV